ncbi:Small RNA 2'-O-methyltransferase [Gaertneriomyces sp. JEL0708]|nr:Small RNA 2'-O-methyltransferase [Gaertneriomyces sp. JEL0708]
MIVPASEASENAQEAGLFSPPLWIQRRAMVANILKRHKCASVLDLGCGEGSLISILLNNAQFTKLHGVDVDSEALEDAQRNCAPTDYDRQYLRENEVECEFWKGSVAEADDRLKGFDAITSVEVIEHLDDDVLAAFPAVVFGTYRPRIVVITTPNEEYNVHFGNLQTNSHHPTRRFRHWDHRFEWTRAEFECWSRSIAQEYAYNVEFSGVGLLASNPEDSTFGHCSQIAVFRRTDAEEDRFTKSERGARQPYKHFASVRFPHFTECNFPTSQILAEAQSLIEPLIYNEWYHHVHYQQPRVPSGDRSLRWDGSAHTISLNTVWEKTLRIRQLCKTKDRFKVSLESEEGRKLFEIVPEESQEDEGGDLIKVLWRIPDLSSDRVLEKDGYDEDWEDKEAGHHDMAHWSDPAIWGGTQLANVVPEQDLSWGEAPPVYEDKYAQW